MEAEVRGKYPSLFSSIGQLWSSWAFLVRALIFLFLPSLDVSHRFHEKEIPSPYPTAQYLDRKRRIEDINYYLEEERVWESKVLVWLLAANKGRSWRESERERKPLIDPGGIKVRKSRQN